MGRSTNQKAQSTISAASLCALAVGCSGDAVRYPGDVWSIERPPSCQGANVIGETLDVDLRLVHLRGRFTVNNRPLAAAGPGVSNRGTLLLLDERRGTHARIELGRTSDGAFDLLVAPGRYQVWLEPHACIEDNAVPCTGALLERSLLVEQDTTRDLDVKSVRVTLSMTIDGEFPPPENGAAWSLVDAFGARTVNNALGRPMVIAVVPGVYRFAYVARRSEGWSSRANTWPTTSATIRERLSLLSDQELSIDVPTTLLTLSVLADGRAVSFDTSNPAWVELESGDNPVTRILANSMELRAVRGWYDVRWFGNPNRTCSPSSDLPCNAGPIGGLAVTEPDQRATLNREPETNLTAA
jgi:hypothetical protein